MIAPKTISHYELNTFIDRISQKGVDTLMPKTQAVLPSFHCHFGQLFCLILLMTTMISADRRIHKSCLDVKGLDDRERVIKEYGNLYPLVSAALNEVKTMTTKGVNLLVDFEDGVTNWWDTERVKRTMIAFQGDTWKRPRDTPEWRRPRDQAITKQPNFKKYMGESG